MYRTRAKDAAFRSDGGADRGARLINGTGILVVGGGGTLAEDTLAQLLPFAPGASRLRPEHGPVGTVAAIVATLAEGERAMLSVSIAQRTYPGVPVVVYAARLGTLEALQLMRLPLTEVVLLEEGVLTLLEALVRALPAATASPARPPDAMGAHLGAAAAGPAAVAMATPPPPASRPPARALPAGGTRGLDGLPVLDCRVGKIQQLIANNDCSVSQAEAVIASEPALVTAILRTSNSAFYQAPRPITNLRDAIVRIGVRQTLNSVLEALIQRGLQTVHPEGRAVLIACWANAGLTARFARRLAEGDGLGRGDDIYLAALLHNVGECVMIWRLYRGPVQAGQLADECPRIAAQHEAAAETCLDKWGMPPLVSSLAAFHHRPRIGENPRDAALRRAITGAWALARRLQGDYLPVMAPVECETEFPLVTGRRLVQQVAPEFSAHPYLALPAAPPTADARPTA